MAWDSSRPVPWDRLIREWLVYAAIMSAILLIFFRGSNVLGALAGVLISGPLYLAFGSVMAKFGYQRTRLKDLRSATRERSDSPGASSAAATAPDSPRPKPAPTSRTGGGGNRPKSSSRRKR